MQNRYAFVVAAAFVGLVGCTTMTGRTAGENVDDATISASVKSHLATDSARTLTAVDVDTVGGTVYLTGTVPDASAKTRASKIANEIAGVERVVNNLQIRGQAAGDAPARRDYDRDDY